MPGVDHVGVAFQVALRSPLQLTHRGLDGVGVQPFGHLLGVVAAGGLDAVDDGLHGGVGRELEGAAGVTLLGLESLHDGGIGRIRGEVLGQRQQHAFHGIAGNGVDVGVARTFGAHELGLHALFGRLTQQQAHLGVVAAVVDEVHALAAQLGDDGGVVGITRIDALEEHGLEAGLFQRDAHGVGNALTVGLLVVQDGDLLGLGHVQDVLGSGRALLVVTAGDAEDVFVVLAVGERGRGGRRGDHQHAFFIVDGGRGNGGARADVTHHEVDVLVDGAVCGNGALLGFAGVVDDDPFQLLAIDATGGVDLLDGGEGAFTDHAAVLGDRAGGGAGQRNAQGVSGLGGGGHQAGEGQGGQEGGGTEVLHGGDGCVAEGGQGYIKRGQGDNPEGGRSVCVSGRFTGGVWGSTSVGEAVLRAL